MPVNMIDPWFELEDAMDLLSSRSRRSGLAFSRAAASVFQNDFPSLSRRKQKPTKLQTKSTDSDMTDPKVSDYDELKRKLRNFQDEIYKLQAANSDLTQVNKRWQKHNADMEIFTVKLQSTIRDQQEQINNIGEDQFYFNNKREINIGNECDQMKCRKLKEEVIKLREEIEHLKFQVRAHKDDWEAEKLEKQEALNERDALQSRLNDVLRDICNLNRCPSEETRRRPQGCPCCKHWDRSNTDYSVNSPGFNQTVICSSSRQSPHHQGRYFFTDENIECDSTKQHTGMRINGNNLLSESEDNLRHRRLSLTSDDRALEDTACSLRPREESFSTTTTLPSSSIVQSRVGSPLTLPSSSRQPQQQQATTLAMGIKTGNGATLTSYVRLPVVKSYSAPEGGSLAAGPSSNVRLNSISLSVVPAAAAGTSAGAAASSVTATSSLIQHSASSITAPSSSHHHHHHHPPPPPHSLTSLVDSSDDT